MIQRCFLFFLFCFFVSCQNYAVKPQISSQKKMLFEKNLFQRTYTDVHNISFTPSSLPAPIIIINFWASWCLPCIEELPSMVEMKKEFKDSEVQIISINTEQDFQLINIKKTLQKFKAEQSFRVVADVQTMIADSVGFTSIPVSLIFYKGELVEFIDGPTNFNSPHFKHKMKKLLEQ